MLVFAGIGFRGLTLSDLLAPTPGLKHVVTVNAEYIVRANRNTRLHRIIEAGFATFDGQVPYVIARWLKRGIRFEKIPGSDLIYRICEHAALHGERVFLLGGLEESNRQSVAVLRKRFPGLAICGFSPRFAPYPFPAGHDSRILEEIRAFGPQYLLVGFGAVKQDYWIDDQRAALTDLGVRLAVGVGGAFEMVSGRLKRAPRSIQRMGLEGVYRLVMEPRLFRLQRLLLSVGFLRYL